MVNVEALYMKVPIKRTTNVTHKRVYPEKLKTNLKIRFLILFQLCI